MGYILCSALDILQVSIVEFAELFLFKRNHVLMLVAHEQRRAFERILLRIRLDNGQRIRFHVSYATLRVQIAMLTHTLVIRDEFRLFGNQGCVRIYLRDALKRQRAALGYLIDIDPVVSLLVARVVVRLAVPVVGEGHPTKDVQICALFAKVRLGGDWPHFRAD